MKLNTTYLLPELLDALTKASDNMFDMAEQMKRAGKNRIRFTTYDGEGLLSTSPYARVTLTRKAREGRWEGYMETTIHKDGPRVPVAVVRTNRVLIANMDYTKFELAEA